MLRRTSVLLLSAFLVGTVGAQVPWVRFPRPGDLDGDVWTLLDPSGQPLVRALAWRTLCYKGSDISDVAETGADGQIQFRKPHGLSASFGRPTAVEVGALQGKALWMASVPVDQHGGTVRFGPTTHLKLRIVDENGQPVASARVSPTSLEVGDRLFSVRGMASRLRIVSGQDGVSDFPGLPRGAKLRIVVEGDRFAQPTWDEFVPLKDGPESQAVLTLRLGATLEGRVYEEETRTPIGGAWVQAYTKTGLSGSSVSAADGSYRIVGLEQGLYIVRSGGRVMPGKLPDSFIAKPVSGISVRKGDHVSGIDLRYAKGVTMRGKVTYRNTGRPAFDAQVYASEMGGENQGMGITGVDGTYSVSLIPGKYRVLALGASHLAQEPNEGSTLEVKEGMGPVDLVLPVEPFDKPLTGTVIGVDGKPAAEAEVEADGENAPVVVKCDRNGRFELPKTVLAPTTVRARLGRDCSTRFELVTDAESSISLRLTPKALAYVDGKVLDRQGKPIPEAQILVFEKGKHTLFLRSATDKAGHYQIPKAWPNATYVVFASKKGYADQSHQAVVVRPGETKHLPSLVMPLRDRTVSGRVLDEQGEPVAGVVVCCGSDPNARTAVTDKAGKFKLTGLTPEAIELSADVGDRHGDRVVPAGVKDVTIIVKSPRRTP